MCLSILVAGSFLVAFLWSAKTGQFEDSDANAFRILIDEKDENMAIEIKIENQNKKHADRKVFLRQQSS